MKFLRYIGSVLIYQHDILHEDSAVLSGRKYALRTDVMYSAEKVEDEKELRRLRKNDKGKFGMFMWKIITIQDTFFDNIVSHFQFYFAASITSLTCTQSFGFECTLSYSDYVYLVNTRFFHVWFFFLFEVSVWYVRIPIIFSLILYNVVYLIFVQREIFIEDLVLLY